MGRNSLCKDEVKQDRELHAATGVRAHVASVQLAGKYVTFATIMCARLTIKTTSV